MTQVQHSERAHALLGASSASRWINCPPSARLTEHFPETRSEFAEEGTAAHELSELKLRQRLFKNDVKERKQLEKAIEAFKAANEKWYSSEMENATQEYVELVEERFMEAKARSSDAVILLEERLDYSQWVPEGYGTGDVVLIADGLMEIIDLKYGKGVPVSAVGNSQMRLYALGALEAHGYLYDINEVRMTIVQPRLDSVSSDTMTVEDLNWWVVSEVQPAAEQAWAGEGEYKPGDHCRWCKAKGNCRARADENMKALAYEFQDPALLDLEEIGSILYVAEQLKKWAADVEEFAFEQAKAGKKISQWKLVEGRSNRKITDEEAAKAAFEAAGLDQDKYLSPRELLGIGALEKSVGKKPLAELLEFYEGQVLHAKHDLFDAGNTATPLFVEGQNVEVTKVDGDLVTLNGREEFNRKEVRENFHVSALIHKPQGKPVLVPETDKRPALNSVDTDFANEDFEV